MSEVIATDVEFRVGDALLVAGVTLRAGPGDLVAIVGPNGAGKSTLLRLLAGERLPTGGTVTIDGEPAAAYHPSELSRLRAFLQHTTTDIPFTARQVVALGRHPHRHDPDNSSAADTEAIERSMALADVASFGDRIYSSLSGGEQMRVSISRILAQETPLLFLDEPTGPLDVSHSERVMSMLRSKAESGACVVVVLHDLNTAAAHASGIVVMSRSRIAAQGPPHDVLEADLLAEVYDHPMQVVPHPLGGGPLVLTDRSVETPPTD